MQKVEPQIVLLPYPDRHVDHRAIFDSALSHVGLYIAVGANIKTPGNMKPCLRLIGMPHIEPNFTPNWTVDISDQIDKKTGSIGMFQKSNITHPNARSIKAIRALSVFRGFASQSAFGKNHSTSFVKLTNFTNLYWIKH